MHADWTMTRNPGNSRLAEALAGRDRAHAALFACVFTTRTAEIGVDGSDSFETSSKNLKLSMRHAYGLGVQNHIGFMGPFRRWA